MAMAPIYESLSEKVRGCIYEVHNNLGTGYDEETYHRALALCFEKYNIPFRSKERQALEYRGRVIHEFELDLLEKIPGYVSELWVTAGRDQTNSFYRKAKETY
ncbi:MAG: GxxExxY protein [Calditrichaeota bacterium]|nr:MAG: GxxExxY protein [Calditrichota bacterium]